MSGGLVKIDARVADALAEHAEKASPELAAELRKRGAFVLVVLR